MFPVPPIFPSSGFPSYPTIRKVESRGHDNQPKTMHYYKGNPSKSQNYDTFVLFDLPRIGNLMTPGKSRRIRGGETEIENEGIIV